MASLLKGTNNTRSITNDSLRYIRSDAVTNLEESDIQWLIENNILMAIDLRTFEEVSERPCCLKYHTAFTYLNIPVSSGNVVPETPKKVVQYYLGMVNDTMHKIISTIENSKTNVIYFCKLGKDRSGVVSALLLLRQGFSHEYIIADYMLSADNLRDIIGKFRRKNPSLDNDAITPNVNCMTQFLKMLDYE